MQPILHLQQQFFDFLLAKLGFKMYGIRIAS